MIDVSLRLVPPLVILVRPQMGENIGATARAMMNCGLKELRLVAPRDGWPNAAALPMAAGGKSIIKNAQVFDTLTKASEDISFLAATSSRRRDLAIRSANPRVAAEMIVAQTKLTSAAKKMHYNEGRAALLFGPEASGLSNDEVVLADVLVTAPLNPKYPSLNLAQSVLLMAWEWRMALLAENGSSNNSLEETKALKDLASVAERDYFFNRLEMALDEGGFFTKTVMMTTVKKNIRALFTRAGLTKNEINTLHGIVQALTSKRKL